MLRLGWRGRYRVGALSVGRRRLLARTPTSTRVLDAAQATNPACKSEALRL
jgi:hypothetical protein